MCAWGLVDDSILVPTLFVLRRTSGADLHSSLVPSPFPVGTQQHTHGICLSGGLSAGYALDGSKLLTGVSSSPAELGMGGQGQPTASTLKAVALNGFWGKTNPQLKRPLLDSNQRPAA